MVGRQLPFFSLIVPFWLDRGVRGLRGHARECGRRCSSPACRSRFRNSSSRTITVRGSSTSSPSACSMVCARRIFLRVWRARADRDRDGRPHDPTRRRPVRGDAASRRRSCRGSILTVHRVRLGHAAGQEFAQPHLGAEASPMPGLDKMVLRVPPVVAEADGRAGGVSRSTGCRRRHGDSHRRDRLGLRAALLGRRDGQART